MQHTSEDDPDFKINRGLYQLYRALHELIRSINSERPKRQMYFRFLNQAERAALAFSVSNADLKYWAERACEKLSMRTSGEHYQTLYRDQLARVGAFSDFLETFKDIKDQTQRYLVNPNEFKNDPFALLLENLDGAVVKLSKADIGFAETCLDLVESDDRPFARKVTSNMRHLNAAL